MHGQQALLVEPKATSGTLVTSSLIPSYNVSLHVRQICVNAGCVRVAVIRKLYYLFAIIRLIFIKLFLFRSLNRLR